MLHHLLRRGQLLVVFILLNAWLAAIPGAARSAAPGAPAVTVNPSSLSVTVPLGSQVTERITLTNHSAAALAPAIYEAYAPAPVLSSPGGVTGPSRVALPRQSDRIDPQLLDDFRAAPGHSADFVVYLRDQADLSGAYAIREWAARGQFVYQTLVDRAERSQRALRAQIVARGLQARPLWIVNALIVHGTHADAQALARQPDVALVRANRITALTPDLPAAGADRCSPDQPNHPVCWNIRQIGADRVWNDFGVNGQGVVVANIDTGVRYDHPALASRYRGYLGPGRYDHNYNWFDPAGVLLAPEDTNGHGTHTIGTIVATSDGTPNQPAVGVAPGARWIAAQGCGAYICTEADLIAAAQWLLAPTALDGTLPRPDVRPMIINNSWGGEGDASWYSGYTAAWRAAGIFPVFAAGNSGSGAPQVCGSINSPGDYPDVVSVGATDHLDRIAGFSLLGPTGDGRLKPDFVAPGTYQSGGQGLLSTYIGSGGSYQTIQGTSMATPHVSALVALLWSANPALIGDYGTTYAIIRDTALPLSDTRCGDPVGAPNNVYGYGRIDAHAAVARARVDVPWLIAPALVSAIPANGSAEFDIMIDAGRVPGPGVYNARLQLFGASLSEPPTTISVTMTVTPAGQQATITGRVVSADTGQPVAATVGLEDGLGVSTDSSGAYTLTLSLGSHTLVANALSFLPGKRTLMVTSDLRAPDFELEPDQPRIAISTALVSATLAFNQSQQIVLPLANIGARTLHYKADVLPDQYGIWRSDTPGGPAYGWVDLPPEASALTFDNDDYDDEVPIGFEFPFFGAVFTETLATSDGTLAFSLPLQYQGPGTSCLPADEIYFYQIAPFRADLDPSRGGRVRYGTLANGKTFALSYEDVPLHSGPADLTYTFQVLLHDDGRIVFQYRKLGPLPAGLSVGLQRTQADFEQVGCGVTTPIHDGLAIELRPQVPASSWLIGVVDQGQALPGSQQAITLTLKWALPVKPLPYYGRLEITSSDPYRRVLVVPFEVRMLAAPYTHWLPRVGRWISRS